MKNADNVDFYNILKKERLPLFYTNNKAWKALEVKISRQKTSGWKKKNFFEVSCILGELTINQC